MNNKMFDIDVYDIELKFVITKDFSLFVRLLPKVLV